MRKGSDPKSKRNKVTSIDAHRKAKKPKWRLKNMSFPDIVTALVVISFVAVGLGCLGSVFASMQDQKAVEEQIALTEDEIAGEQQAIDTLAQQSTLLKDDEYVAKLARSRYYLSKDGEIIFSVPEDNASKQAEILNKAYLQQNGDDN